MTRQLIKVGDTAYSEKLEEMDNLDTIPQNLQNFNQSENSVHTEIIRKNERPGVLGRIWPTKTQIKLEELSNQWLESNFQHRQEVSSVYKKILIDKLELAGEYHLQSLKQKFEGQLISQGMTILAGLSETVLTIREKMIDDINRSNENFIESMRKADGNIERSRHDPYLHERAIKSKHFLISNHFDTGEELLEKFIRLLRVSLDEKASRFAHET
jgi:hypothetical protein